MSRGKWISLRQWARNNKLDPKFVARQAIKGNVKGAKKLLANRDGSGGNWAILDNTDVAVVPAKGEGRAATRDDGRRRYFAYFTEAELAAAKLAVPGAEFQDPRVKRAARKAAKAAEAKSE